MGVIEKEKRQHTFPNLIDRYGGKVNRLRLRTQCAPSVAEKVLAKLGVARLRQVAVVAVGAAAGLVEFEHGDGLVGRGALRGEAADHVAVEALGAEDEDDVD